MTTRHRPLRVLVVDPYPDSAESQAALLNEWGHRATTALDAETALAEFRRTRPHVVLVEPELPRHQGLPFIRAIRAERAAGRLTIAAVTGRVSREDEREAREAGADYFIYKPVNPDVILGLLAECQNQTVGQRIKSQIRSVNDVRDQEPHQRAVRLGPVAGRE